MGIQKPIDATGEISVMGKTGDSKHFWNCKKMDEVLVAKEVYDRYSKLNYRAFLMAPDGSGTGEQMREFDPCAGSILFIPPMVGG